LMKNIRSEGIYSLACNVDSLLRYGIYSVGVMQIIPQPVRYSEGINSLAMDELSYILQK